MAWYNQQNSSRGKLGKKLSAVTQEGFHKLVSGKKLIPHEILYNTARTIDDRDIHILGKIRYIQYFGRLHAKAIIE